MTTLIFDAAAAIIIMKQNIGDAPMDVLSKGMEFCRVIYGGPQSSITMSCFMYFRTVAGRQI